MSAIKNQKCFFVSDLHGKIDRFRKLFSALEDEKPHILFIGGDILPHWASKSDAHDDFLDGFLFKELRCLREKLGPAYPRVFVILGNDDGRNDEESFIEESEKGLLNYVHGRCVAHGEWSIFGYSYVPPTPFLLKDWERYDVSRYVDPGCVSPEEGVMTYSADSDDIKYGTIYKDLEKLAGGMDLDRAVFLFHSPPYRTNLDRAALDGKKIDHVPVDVNVGSIAISRFIEKRQPMLTLHGHVHESARITGSWKDRLGKTLAITAAHDGPELALVRFELQNPLRASRELI